MTRLGSHTRGLSGIPPPEVARHSWFGLGFNEQGRGSWGHLFWRLGGVCVSGQCVLQWPFSLSCVASAGFQVNDLLDALHSFAGVSMSTPEVASFLQQAVAAAATPGAHSALA